MRTLILSLLLLSSTAAISAQSPTNDVSSLAGVDVVKYSWSKERLNWEANPFGGSVESFEDVRRRLVDQRRIERARTTGNVAEARKVDIEMRAEQVIKSRPPAPPRYAFRYSATFKNTGTKAIKQIDWDYVFLDAITNEVVGRIELGSDDKIEPGKKKDVTFFIGTPPARTISVQALTSNERKALVEHVVLMRVLYADGSVWQNQ
jgi:uncharacterized protein affecting Mg2+/Co2+ transport